MMPERDPMELRVVVGNIFDIAWRFVGKKGGGSTWHYHEKKHVRRGTGSR